MSKLETSIYIVGTSRTWQVRARTLKLVVASTIFLLIGLTAALLYQSLWQLQSVTEWEERYNAESERNEKLRAAVEDLRERVVDRSTLEMRQAIYSNGPDVDELLQKNQRQQETIEAQQVRLEQLQTETRDQLSRIQELDYQLSNEASRFTSLQESHRQLEVQRAVLQDNLTALTTESLELKSRIQELEKLVAAFPVAADGTILPPRVPPLPGPAPIAIEALQLGNRSGRLDVRFRLSNRSERRQSGYLQMFLVSPQDASALIDFGDREADPYSIRNFKNVRKEYRSWDSQALLRVVAWSDKKQRIYDQTFPLNKVN